MLQYSPPSSPPPSCPLPDIPRSASLVKSKHRTFQGELTDHAVVPSSPSSHHIFSEINRELKVTHDDLLGSLYDGDGNEDAQTSPGRIKLSRNVESGLAWLGIDSDSGDDNGGSQNPPRRIKLSISIESGLASLRVDTGEDEIEQSKKDDMLDLRGGDHDRGDTSPDWVSERTIASYDKGGIEEHNDNEESIARDRMDAADSIAGLPSRTSSAILAQGGLSDDNGQIRDSKEDDHDICSRPSNGNYYQKKSTSITSGSTTSGNGRSYFLFPSTPTRLPKNEKKINLFEIELSDDEEDDIQSGIHPGRRLVLPPPPTTPTRRSRCGVDANIATTTSPHNDLNNLNITSSQVLPQIQDSSKLGQSKNKPNGGNISDGWGDSFDEPMYPPPKNPLRQRRFQLSLPEKYSQSIGDNEYHMYIRNSAIDLQDVGNLTAQPEKSDFELLPSNSALLQPPKSKATDKTPTNQLEPDSLFQNPRPAPHPSSGGAGRGAHSGPARGEPQQAREERTLRKPPKMAEWGRFTATRDAEPQRNTRPYQYVQNLPPPGQMADPETPATLRDDMSIVGSADFSPDAATDVLAISVIARRQPSRDRRRSWRVSGMETVPEEENTDERIKVNFRREAGEMWRAYLRRKAAIDADDGLTDVEKVERKAHEDAIFARRLKQAVDETGYSLFKNERLKNANVTSDASFLQAFAEYMGLAESSAAAAASSHPNAPAASKAAGALITTAPVRTSSLKSRMRAVARGMRWFIAVPDNPELKSYSQRAPPKPKRRPIAVNLGVGFGAAFSPLSGMTGRVSDVPPPAPRRNCARVSTKSNGGQRSSSTFTDTSSSSFSSWKKSNGKKKAVTMDNTGVFGPGETSGFSGTTLRVSNEETRGSVRGGIVKALTEEPESEQGDDAMMSGGATGLSSAQTGSAATGWPTQSRVYEGRGR